MFRIALLTMYWVYHVTVLPKYRETFHQGQILVQEEEQQHMWRYRFCEALARGVQKSQAAATKQADGWRDCAGFLLDQPGIEIEKHVPSHLVLQCVLDIGSFCNCTDLGTLKSLKIASYFWYDQPRKQPLDKSSNLQPSRETENAIPRDKSRQTC